MRGNQEFPCILLIETLWESIREFGGFDVSNFNQTYLEDQEELDRVPQLVFYYFMSILSISDISSTFLELRKKYAKIDLFFP